MNIWDLMILETFKLRLECFLGVPGMKWTTQFYRDGKIQTRRSPHQPQPPPAETQKKNRKNRGQTRNWNYPFFVTLLLFLNYWYDLGIISGNFLCGYGVEVIGHQDQAAISQNLSSLVRAQHGIYDVNIIVSSRWWGFSLARYWTICCLTNPIYI